MIETIKPSLQGVPETMLWPLHNRAAYSRKTPDLLKDPMAETLVDQIDYDFIGNFGPANVSHAIRARYSDDLIRTFAEGAGAHAVVVALGEGLETQAFRINDERLTWISVDVPEAIEIRQQLLPPADRHQFIPCSALDPAWLDQVPKDCPVFVSAAGLLMYFQEQEVAELLRIMSERLPGAELFFDSIPPIMRKQAGNGLKVTPRYTSPPMPWSIAVDQIPGFLAANRWRTLSVKTYAQPYPEYMRLFAFLSRVGPVRRSLAPGLAHAKTA